jgi:hypothetical protein
VKAGDRVKTDRRDAVKLAAAIAPVILRRYGCRMPPMKPCATCCVPANTPDRINCEPVTGWERFCCATLQKTELDKELLPTIRAVYFGS